MTKLRQNCKLPCGTKFLRVLIFAIFPAIHGKNKLPIKISSNIFPAKIHCRVMHQSIPAALSLPRPPPGLLQGIFPPCPGGGAFANFAQPGSREFVNPGASPELLTRTRFPIRIFPHRGFCWKNKLIGPSVKDGKKIEEVCKGMFSILCMYFFIAYQARIT